MEKYEGHREMIVFLFNSAAPPCNYQQLRKSKRYQSICGMANEFALIALLYTYLASNSYLWRNLSSLSFDIYSSGQSILLGG